MSERELEDMAHSANQEALAFGVNFDVFMKLARAVAAKMTGKVAETGAEQAAAGTAEHPAVPQGRAGEAKSAHEEEVASVKAEFNRAINFAIGQGIGAAAFLDAWRHGDTEEWPEFEQASPRA